MNKIDTVINKLENININNINSIYQDIKDIIKVAYISADIFSTNDFVAWYDYLKDNINKQTYDILERYNCIEKIKLIKYPSIIGIDFADIVYFFNNSKIVKIIDGERIIERADASPKNMYFIYFTDQAPSIKEIMIKFNEYKIKYNTIDGDNIICQYSGKKKLFAILTA